MNNIKKIEKARTNIFIKDSFLGYILQHIKINIVEKGTTAYTDGKEIYFTEDFLESLDLEATTFVLMHELLHIVLKHVNRIKNKNRLVYNIATDYIINEMLIRAGYKSGNLKDMLISKKARYNHSAEQVYSQIINDYHDEFKSFSDHSKWEATNSDFIDEIIDRAIEKGYETSLTGLRSQILINKVKTKINYTNLLYKYIQKEVYNYTTSRIDTRFNDVIIPKFMEADYSLNDIWILFDVSGSIGKKELNEYFSNLKPIFNAFKKLNINISFFSGFTTEPKKIKNEKQFKELLKKVETNYQTSFKSIFEVGDKFYKKQPNLLIIFTDGMDDYPIIGKKYNIIWMIDNNNVIPPYGRVIRI